MTVLLYTAHLSLSLAIFQALLRQSQNCPEGLDRDCPRYRRVLPGPRSEEKWEGEAGERRGDGAVRDGGHPEVGGEGG